MRLFGKLNRLRVRAPRWPSRDHRDYLPAGRSQPAPAASREDRLCESQLPALATIVRAHREEAMLHLELATQCAALDGRPPVLAREGAGPVPSGRDGERLADAEGEAHIWTVTLALN